MALNAAPAVPSTNGQGVHVTYAQAAGSTTTPVYTPPVNAYETITTVAASSGVPSSLLERDTDGTTRRFDVFESTSILRLALLTDKNGNTVTYNRDGQGRLTNVVDIHGRYFNLTYNAAGLVATLTDSGGRSSSYAYDAAKRRTGDTGPLGTTGYLYDGANR
ncbi:MAG: RHS repeat domain-containing protein, partial [Elusimicrobiota bacterium]|nr:RHS repeat domain-containing protein [Elusimicrobiota bacterium]